MLQPTVNVGRPENLENFNVVTKDELNFYISKNCYLPENKLEIELKGFWLFKNIELKGIKGRL